LVLKFLTVVEVEIGGAVACLVAQPLHGQSAYLRPAG
jgi:hypothetical protein